MKHHTGLGGCLLMIAAAGLCLAEERCSAQEPKELFTLKGHADWVWSVAFAPDPATARAIPAGEKTEDGFRAG